MTGAPALPLLWVMQLWLPVGWAVVLAALVAGATARWAAFPRWRWGAALVLAVWTLVPGVWSPSYWLGVAFQAPSVMLVILCATWLWRQWRKEPPVAPPSATLGLVAVGIGLGWLLLLDTFAQLPVALYGLGFGVPAVALVSVAVLLPLLQAQSCRCAAGWLAPLAVLVFVLLRLPTGNVWDAVLDPWLWLALHGYAIRKLLICYKFNS